MEGKLTIARDLTAPEFLCNKAKRHQSLNGIIREISYLIIREISYLKRHGIQPLEQRNISTTQLDTRHGPTPYSIHNTTAADTII